MRFALHTIFHQVMLSYFQKWHVVLSVKITRMMRVPHSPASRPLPVLLVADSGSRAVELRNADSERFVIRLRAILQDTERHLLAQKNRPIR